MDEFVENGELGGQDAARRLIQHVSEYVQNELADLRPDLPVVVRVYANLKGLRRTYQEAHILDDENEFELFVRGFNMGHPLCDFVDAGAGKECSDEKIRGQFLFLGNLPFMNAPPPSYERENFPVDHFQYRNFQVARRQCPLQTHRVCRLHR